MVIINYLLKFSFTPFDFINGSAFPVLSKQWGVAILSVPWGRIANADDLFVMVLLSGSAWPIRC